MDPYILKTKIKQSKWGTFICNNLLGNPYICACVHIFLRYLNLDDFSRNGTAKQNRIFFQNNTEKVEKILNLLADKKSKNTFSAQIRYLSGAAIFPIGNPNTQYFPKDIICLSEQEVFVDCGAFTGDSIDKFLKACNGKYKKIVVFEPSIQTFLQLKQRNFDRCSYFNYGVWDKAETLTFCTASQESDAIATTSIGQKADPTKEKIQIKACPLDSMAACADMTFLKMDIEGAELPALKGAEQTICKQCPTLAISIYHSNEDLLNIPLWIASLGLPYTYHVRLHLYPTIDLVWYAVPKRA